jgi:hypothetical protein
VVLLRGSGHVNAGQSVVMLMQGVGAAMSPALTGNDTQDPGGETVENLYRDHH